MTQLTAHSKNRLLNTFAQWEVSREYAEPLYNYLVHGFHPGSFWYNVLCNDFAKAMLSSHPANTVPALKNVVGWLVNTLPRTIWGSPAVFDNWLELPADKRRAILEELRLVYKGEEEILLILQEAPTHEPHLW